MRKEVKMQTIITMLSNVIEVLTTPIVLIPGVISIIFSTGRKRFSIPHK